MDRDLTPEEARWLKRLKRCIEDQPLTLTMYCGGDTTTALDAEDYERLAREDKPFNDAALDAARLIRTRGWIAGDW